MLTDERIDEIHPMVMDFSLWKRAFARAIEEEVTAPLQAKIDALMLEYCPEEMTTWQKENWANHQVPVSEEEMKALNKVLEGGIEIVTEEPIQKPVGFLRYTQYALVFMPYELVEDGTELYTKPVLCQKCASEYERGKRDAMKQMPSHRLISAERDRLQVRVKGLEFEAAERPSAADYVKQRDLALRLQKRVNDLSRQLMKEQACRNPELVDQIQSQQELIQNQQELIRSLREDILEPGVRKIRSFNFS